MRRPLVIYNSATAPFWISLYMRKIWFSFYQCIHYMFPIPKFNWWICSLTQKRRHLVLFWNFFHLPQCVWQTLLCGKILRFLYTVVGSGKAPDCVPVHTRALSACLRAESPRAGTARQVIRATPPHPRLSATVCYLGLDCTKWMFFSRSSAELFADDRRPFKEPIKWFFRLCFCNIV